MKQTIELTINGTNYRLEVEPRRTLLEMLRHDLGLTGTKKGCDEGSCGSCTVLLGGRATLSCLTLAVEASGKEVLTVEGMARNGQLHPIQRAFIEHGAIQCGFCTPGMLLSTQALLDRNPHPPPLQVRQALRGNLCRCTGYAKIIEAVLAAADSLSKGVQG